MLSIAYAYDRKAAALGSKDQQLWLLLSQMPSVSFEVETSTHLHFVKEYILQALATCYPRDNMVPKKPYIAEKNWHLSSIVVPFGSAPATLEGR